MSEGAYAGLRLAAHANEPAASENTAENKSEGDELSLEAKTKEQKMADAALENTAIEAARSEATASANARFTTVLASEHYAGREALAQTLLGNDKLSADEILAALAAAPSAQASQPTLSAEETKAAAEEAGRAEMKAALAEGRNSDIDAGAGDHKPDARAQADAVWTKAYNLDKGVK